MELIWAGLVIGISHLAIIHVLINVLHLPYSQFLVAQVVTTLVSSAVANAIAPAWKTRVGAALSKEERAHTIGEDIIGMLAIVIVSGLISTGMIYRAYGLGGTVGAFAAATVAGWLV
jgi:hypothetical protein